MFDSLYIGIYRYPRYIRYALWILLSVLIILTIIYNVTLGLILFGIGYPRFIDNSIFLVYGITDCALSISLVILFFRPIWKRNQVSVGNHMSVVRRYAVLSGVQLIVTASFQIVFFVTNLLYLSGASIATVMVYADIRNVLSMLDCLLLIICVYFGFARQATVRRFMRVTSLKEVPSSSFLLMFCFRTSLVCEFAADSANGVCWIAALMNWRVSLRRQRCLLWLCYHNKM